MSNPSDKLKDLLLLSKQGTSDDNLADALRTSLKMVVLTQTEYDALNPVDANTLYFIEEE